MDNKADKAKYGEIILDFSYFKVAEDHEKKIEQSPVMVNGYTQASIMKTHLIFSRN